MDREQEDLLDLFDHVFQRLDRRMSGLADDEWTWLPTPDDRVSLRWRLDHICAMLSETRNAAWLGRDADDRPEDGIPRDAASALERLARSYAWWREILSGLSDHELAQPIGPAAGSYGSATRRSFVLHVADELIHHGAEAALFRDLYTARGRP